MASQVLVHPSYLCQIGESDQGHFGLSFRSSIFRMLKSQQSKSHDHCQLFSFRVFLRKIDAAVDAGVDLPEAYIHQGDEVQAGEFPRQARESVSLGGVVDVKAAATDSMAVLTGIEGHYDTSSIAYLPHPPYQTWDEVVRQNGLKL